MLELRRTLKPRLCDAEIQSFQLHCAASEKTIKPTTVPECLKVSSKRPHFQPQLGTPPPGSLPAFPCLTLAPQSSGFCHRCTLAELTGAPSWSGQDSKWLNKGTVSETRPFLGNTLYAAGGRAVGQTSPGIKANFQLFRR